MLVNVIYDHGKIIWPDNVKLKDEKIPVVVEIPDDKLEVEDFLESIENEKVKKLMYDLRKIRGTGPMTTSERSDKDLLFDAFRLIRRDENLI